MHIKINLIGRIFSVMWDVSISWRVSAGSPIRPVGVMVFAPMRCTMPPAGALNGPMVNYIKPFEQKRAGLLEGII
jgi:hypothetical protein